MRKVHITVVVGSTALTLPMTCHQGGDCVVRSTEGYTHSQGGILRRRQPRCGRAAARPAPSVGRALTADEGR